MEPTYSFTIPSVEDDLVLDCRLFHPDDLRLHKTEDVKGAIIAHPYAPVGGSQDNPVVEAVAECLVNRGYIVGTFNFRGAGESQGRTTWTGKGEQNDYISVLGFMIQYLKSLRSECNDQTKPNVRLLLAGYSYGSLILSHLPTVSKVLGTFDKAAVGTSAAEVILRARKLASETVKALHEADLERGRHATYGRPHALTVTLGGEETDASDRRLSRDSKEGRRPLDVVRRTAEVPHRIKAHMRRRSSSKSQNSPVEPTPPKYGELNVRYLLISPLLPPLAYALVPPAIALMFGRHHAQSGFGTHVPSLCVWGSLDSFTSSKRLEAWAEKLRRGFHGFEWRKVIGAGHFWGEDGVLKQLLQHIIDWDSL